MGNFVGHVIPGIVFTLFGIMMHNDAMNDYLFKTSTNGAYESRIFYTTRQCWTTIIKIMILYLFEIIPGFNWNRFFLNLYRKIFPDNYNGPTIDHEAPTNYIFRHETYHHILMITSVIPAAIIVILYKRNKS